MKNIALILGLILLIGVVSFLLWQTSTQDAVSPDPASPADGTDSPNVDADGNEVLPVEPDGGIGDGAGPIPVSEIGVSAAGRPIMVHSFGVGQNDVLIVGGIHGAYAPNTTAFAERLIEHVEDNPEFIPSGVTLHVIPALNPDGIALGTSPAGRYNANGVDLNRNFDCEWEAEAVWQNQDVSGGTEPFSEPEAAALRSYVAATEPVAAVVYYSAAGGVYASNCREGVLPETTELLNTYAQASDYDAFAEFDFYEITGDAVNWMAKEDIPAISVLMTDYTDPEWERNRAGVAAMLDLYSE